MARSITDKILLGAIGVLTVALIVVVGDAIRERVIGVGDTAPDFSVLTDSGITVTPESFGGKVLVLNFWASWCPPCLEEMPSLNRFHEALKSEGVVVLGVSVDEDADAYRRVIEQTGISFLTALDTTSRISSDYGTYRFPETYVIDSRGKVVQKIIGAATWNDERMMSYIRSLL